MNIIKRLLHIGITPILSFQERRRILVLNAAGLFGGTSSMIMFFFNLYYKIYALSLLNIVTWITGYSVFFIHRSAYSKPLLMAVGCIYSLAAAASAILYHNSVEYFLLLYIGVYFIILEDMRMIILFSFLNIVLFLTVSFGLIHVEWFAPVSAMHRHFVMLNGIFLFLFFLYYFKTQSQAYRKEIESRVRELDILNYNKEKLFAIMAHDIKAPISSLLTTLRMIQDGDLSPMDLKEISGTLLKQVTGVHENLITILHWSKSQLKGMEIRPRSVPLYFHIMKTVEFMQPAAELKRQRIDFSEVKSLNGWIDPDHLELILRNLLGNAIKFSYQGRTIRIRTIRENTFIRIEIEDEGMGISLVNAALLRNKLSFISTYGTENEKGTGLGLNLCKEFITLNGGDLQFESKEGIGSTFKVFILRQEPIPGMSTNAGKI
ncbi:sensor histidine kinase [Filimonas effusa]|uniref:sensor histidine kinase n=1 Tax=Filimonas effusa TaxID=2508721 RepID=UPI0013E94FD3|nr:HAMP domain-containing sensor histidine kinase [Filimonas effusa]